MIVVNRNRHTCQPREKFWRDKRGATERSDPSSEGGVRGSSPTKISKTYIANGAIYVIPELYLCLYCNKTCINYAIHIHNSQLASSLSSSTVCGVVLECGCEYDGSSVDAAGGRGSVKKMNSRWRRLPRV